MFGKRLAFTTRWISIAVATIALCLAMSGASAQASAPSVSVVHAPEIGGKVLTYVPQTKPHADGIIAILIGAIGTNDDRLGQNEERLAAPAPLTAPLGSTKGS
jgi:hypothetical protein